MLLKQEKKETAATKSDSKENSSEVADTYKLLYKIAMLPAVKKTIVVLLTYKAGIICVSFVINIVAVT